MTELLHVNARVVARGLDIELNLTQGEQLALIGPNGAGKTSLIRLISGALVPDAGEVRIREQILSAAGAARVPVHRRGFAYLEQRPLLFAHLTVLDNVAFGLRAQGMRRAVARARAETELELVGLADLAQRRPKQLSGGQAQRVALARALTTDPEVVLLDEPLAALDAHVAPQIRALLRERLAGRTLVLVTHELLDVLSLTQRVAVLEGGRIVADGPLDDVLTNPPNTFVARFTGVNVLFGPALDETSLALGEHRLIGVGDLTPGAAARAVIPAEAVALYRDRPGGSPRNCLPAVVLSVIAQGGRAVVVLHVAGQQLRAELTSSAVAELALSPGEHICACVKAVQVRLIK